MMEQSFWPCVKMGLGQFKSGRPDETSPGLALKTQFGSMIHALGYGVPLPPPPAANRGKRDKVPRGPFFRPADRIQQCREILAHRIAQLNKDHSELNLTFFDQSEFVNGCLEWHNRFRQHHRVPPLELSAQLCAIAQSWANILAHTNRFYSRQDKTIGESLFARFLYKPNVDIKAEEVVLYWYEDAKNYDFDSDPHILHVNGGSFSQMVWKETRYFGVGKARTRAHRVIIVGTYFPPGNVQFRYKDNVLPYKKKRKDPDGDSMFSESELSALFAENGSLDGGIQLAIDQHSSLSSP